jgi:threonine aldolase
VIDLRSDTVTAPTPAMREAMASAPVGDDVYDEDPTIHALEERAAAMLGHEAGLFCATGSMTNVLGVWLHVAPGTEVLCDVNAHIARAEMGAHGALTGVTMRTWPSVHGKLDAAEVAAIVSPDAGPYLVSTACVAVENTHNFGGGTVQPLDQLQATADLCRDLGVAFHLDGARLPNAAVATGISLDTYGRLFDTVSLCLSKGLGAPVGSVLVGPAADIARARVQRKRLGGGWRTTTPPPGRSPTRWPPRRRRRSTPPPSRRTSSPWTPAPSRPPRSSPRPRRRASGWGPWAPVRCGP